MHACRCLGASLAGGNICSRTIRGYPESTFSRSEAQIVRIVFYSGHDLRSNNSSMSRVSMTKEESPQDCGPSTRKCAPRPPPPPSRWFVPRAVLCHFFGTRKPRSAGAVASAGAMSCGCECSGALCVSQSESNMEQPEQRRNPPKYICDHSCHELTKIPDLRYKHS